MQPEPPEKLRRLAVQSIDDLFRLAHQFDCGTPKPLYRGQSSYEWPLETRLERNVPEFVRKETGLEVYEYRVLTEAQRRLHHFVEKLPDDDDLLSWLALLRLDTVEFQLDSLTPHDHSTSLATLRSETPSLTAMLRYGYSIDCRLIGSSRHGASKMTRHG